MTKYRMYVTGSITDWVELEGDDPADLEDAAIREFALGYPGVAFDDIECSDSEEL